MFLSPRCMCLTSQSSLNFPVSNISTKLVGSLSTMYQSIPDLQRWILSQQTVTKCLPLPLETTRRHAPCPSYVMLHDHVWIIFGWWTVSEFLCVMRDLPAAGFRRCNRLICPGLTDPRQSDALRWLLLLSPAEGSVQIYGPVLVNTHTHTYTH